MKLIVAVVIAVSFSLEPSAMALDFSKLFAPAKKKVVQRPTRKKHIAHKDDTPSQASTKKFFPVTLEWMARYRVLESMWDYPVPEDSEIRFENGQYYVPAVVYRHYDDMASVATPTPTPKSPASLRGYPGQRDYYSAGRVGYDVYIQ
jgi:hypothetical protein